MDCEEYPELRAGRDRVVEFAHQMGIAAGANSMPSRVFPTVSAPHTVSPSTIKAYRRRGLTLLNEYVRTLDPEVVLGFGHWPEWTPSPVSWVRWLIDVKAPTVARLSWRLYRRSALELLHGWEEDSRYLEDAIALLNANSLETYDQTRSSRYSFAHANAPTTRTSARRIREVTPIDLAMVLCGCLEAPGRAEYNGIDYLPRDSRMSALADLLIGGIVTGLRPCEWRQCHFVGLDAQQKALPLFWKYVLAGQWDEAFMADLLWPQLQLSPQQTMFTPFEGKLYLVAYNAKHSNGRGNQETRVIDLTGASLGVQLALIRMVVRGRVYFNRGDWDRIEDSCAAALRLLNSELFPDRHARVTLYSCRHQALANFKEGLGVFGAAVLAGHGTGTTVGVYYASAKVAWPKKWLRAINEMLNGSFELFMEEFAAREAGLKSPRDRKKNRRSRGKSKGGFSPSTLQAVAGLIRGVALMPVPEPATAEVLMLLSRLKASQTPSARPEMRMLAPSSRATISPSPSL